MSDVIWTPICVTGSKIKAQVSKEWIGKGYGSGTRDIQWNKGYVGDSLAFAMMW
jgi:hypothetical protein